MIRACDIIQEWLHENGYDFEPIATLASIPHYSFVRVFRYRSVYAGNYVDSRSLLISINNRDLNVKLDTYGSTVDTIDVGWIATPGFFKGLKDELDNIGVDPYGFK